MSSTPTLFAKFDNSIAWNGLLFFINKLSKYIISLVLFSRLTTADFSAWANVFGISFILALWLDFGFRRSIPLYSYRLIGTSLFPKIILFKLVTTLLISVVWYYYCKPLATLFSLNDHVSFFYLGIIIFFLESVSSFIKLIFHSFFWQRYLTLSESLIIALETIFILWPSFTPLPSNTLLGYAFLAEILSQLLSIALLLIMAIKLVPTITPRIYPEELPSNFIKHSLIMWVFMFINSLTERNFLVPFITYSFGALAANLFKLANDGALIFQRFILKTIGLSDTVLLAHLEPFEHSYKQQGFILITKRICLLVVPAMGLLLVSFLVMKEMGLGGPAGLLFFLLSAFYLIQLLFIGYDRFLEAKREYSNLFISAMPYGVVILLFALVGEGYRLGLITFIMVIHITKLASSFIRAYLASKVYKVKFPIVFALKVLLITLILSLLIYNLGLALVGEKFIFEVVRRVLPF